MIDQEPEPLTVEEYFRRDIVGRAYLEEMSFLAGVIAVSPIKVEVDTLSLQWDAARIGCDPPKDAARLMTNALKSMRVPLSVRIFVVKVKKNGQQ